MKNYSRVIKEYEGQPLTEQLVQDIVAEYKWPHNKIQDLVKKDVLRRVKRGVYIAGPDLDLSQPSPFLLANHIYGPSYVSLDAALSHWGLIPEKVNAITSMTTGVTKTFRTSVGRFSYVHTKLPYYSYGIRQVTIAENQVAMVASREKAICDKIIVTSGVRLRSRQQAENLLIHDLRIEREALRELNPSLIRSWIAEAPKKQSLQILANTLESL